MERTDASLRVVIADDDPAVLKMLRRSLTREGFSVLGEATNGSEAIVLARHLQPDVLILDAEMPSIPGAEVAPFVRHIAPRTRIVAFSGSLVESPPWADAYLAKGARTMLNTLVAVVGDRS